MGRPTGLTHFVRGCAPKPAGLCPSASLHKPATPRITSGDTSPFISGCYCSSLRWQLATWVDDFIWTPANLNGEIFRPQQMMRGTRRGPHGPHVSPMTNTMWLNIGRTNGSVGRTTVIAIGVKVIGNWTVWLTGHLYSIFTLISRSFFALSTDKITTIFSTDRSVRITEI